MPPDPNADPRCSGLLPDPHLSQGPRALRDLPAQARLFSPLDLEPGLRAHRLTLLLGQRLAQRLKPLFIAVDPTPNDGFLHSQPPYQEALASFLDAVSGRRRCNEQRLSPQHRYATHCKPWARAHSPPISWMQLRPSFVCSMSRAQNILHSPRAFRGLLALKTGDVIAGSPCAALTLGLLGEVLFVGHLGGLTECSGFGFRPLSNPDHQSQLKTAFFAWLKSVELALE